MTPDQPLKTRIAELELIAEASRALNTTLDLEQLPGIIMKIVRRAIRAEAVSLLSLDEDGKHLVFELARGRSDSAVKGLRVPVSEGAVGWVARNKRPLLLANARTDKRYSTFLARKLGLRPNSIIAVPLMRGGKLVGVVEAINHAGDTLFSRNDLAIATALGEHIAAAVANARLFHESERKGLEYSLLAQVTADVGKSLALDDVLPRILRNLARLIPFDAAAIFLVDGKHGSITSVVQEGYPKGADEKIRVKVNEGIVGIAVREAKGVIVDDVRENPRYVEARSRTRSEMVAPMIARGRVIGCFNLESDRRQAYNDRGLRLLEAFATQASVSVERAHLYEEQRIKQEIEKELRVARTVQDFFTPKRSLNVGDFQISGFNHPSLEVSGDYHDYFPLRDGLYAFAVADVAGKGVPASIIMSSFRATVHTVANYLTSARQIAVRANQILLETVRPQDFVTAFIAVIDPRTGFVTYCNAGHNPPVLMKPDGSFRLLETGGPILGVFGDVVLQEGRFRLDDEVLLCYTDGATEIRNPEDEEYGEARLVDAFREHRTLSAYQIGRSMFGSLKQFYRDARQADDITYLVVRRKKR